MIFAVNALNIVFVWIVSILFLFIKTLGAQAKLKKDGLQYTIKKL